MCTQVYNCVFDVCRSSCLSLGVTPKMWARLVVVVVVYLLTHNLQVYSLGVHLGL